jgi:hypothetical protein
MVTYYWNLQNTHQLPTNIQNSTDPLPDNGRQEHELFEICIDEPMGTREEVVNSHSHFLHGAPKNVGTTS